MLLCGFLAMVSVGLTSQVVLAADQTDVTVLLGNEATQIEMIRTYAQANNLVVACEEIGGFVQLAQVTDELAASAKGLPDQENWNCAEISRKALSLSGLCKTGMLGKLVLDKDALESQLSAIKSIIQQTL